MGRVHVAVFDVNETLSDLEPLRERFTRVGAPGHLLETWFAATLRDGFALTAAGTAAPFTEVAADVLRTLFTSVPDLPVSIDDAVHGVIEGFSALHMHPDAPEGMRLLADSGIRLVTLTNGSAALTETLLEQTGISHLVERRLSVEDAGRWKPHPAAYRHAEQECNTPLEAMCLIAVHPWDTDGAKRAGMLSGWVNRTGIPYPKIFTEPDASGPDLTSVARTILTL